MGSYETLNIVRSAGLGKIFCNFRNNPIVLLISFDTFVKSSSMLSYYSTLILNVLAMMPEKHYC